MIIDTNQMVSMTEANQNFSKTAKMVDAYGKAIVMKNNKPKYIILDVREYLDLTDGEKIYVVARRILNKHIKAFKELAK